MFSIFEANTKKMKKITILGSCPSKKNSRQLFVRGGRIVNIPSKIHLEWETQAMFQLKKAERHNYPITIDYKFYFKDNRKRDLDNAIASVNDILVKAEVIKDDCWQILAIGSATADIDRINPRVELQIKKK
jgi:Holliday junction resolvase RusA-like endonuclease